jgi:hypothetical protein
VDHPLDPGAARLLPEVRAHGVGEVGRGEHPGAERVERVVGEVGDAVGEADAQRLGRGRRRADRPGVRPDAVADLPGEVEVLEHLVDAHPLGGVVPATLEVRGERLLAGVAERGVPDVVPEGDRLGQRLVQPERRASERATCVTWSAWVSRVT